MTIGLDLVVSDNCMDYAVGGFSVLLTMELVLRQKVVIRVSVKDGQSKTSCCSLVMLLRGYGDDAWLP